MPSQSFVDKIITNAIANRASDVHLEPGPKGLAVRFRIDGILYLMEAFPEGSFGKITSKLKVMSQIDTTQTRFPQDGHFEFNYQEHAYNVRVSTVPTIYGEAVVLRILNREDILIELESLGFYPDQLKITNQIIANPYGIVLITGPSGSGKTTLLYSLLNTLNKKGNNIITLENPVELNMPDIRQIQIEENIKFTFSRAMRAILRQDPDIIMVGEIRDTDTAQLAIQASLIGVLVFSTFHTLDVPSLIFRLIEMGIPRSVLAHTISGVISTRLVRKICPSCNKPYQLSPYEKENLGKQLGNQNFKKGVGCKKCYQSGYLGRTGIFEVIRFDDELRSLILENAPVSSIHKVIRENKKIKTLHDTAIQKVRDGITTAEEVIRITGIPT